MVVTNTNELRQTLLELYSPAPMLQPFNEHFEHAGYRYWTYIDRTTGTRLYKKRDLATGKIAKITLDEYTNASIAIAKAGHISSAKAAAQSASQPKSTRPPKPTEAEIKQFTKGKWVKLTTKSGKDFQVNIRGDAQAYEAFFEESKVSPSHIVRETLSTFVDNVSSSSSVSVMEFNDEFIFQVYSSDSIQALDRNFIFNRKDKSIAVEHSYFELNKENQGNGLSRKVMKEALDLYQSIGVSQVKLTAGLEVGKYAWAKYGFVPKTDVHSSSLADNLEEVFIECPGLFPPDPQIHKDLSSLVKRLRRDPKALWDIADYDKPVADPNHIDKTTGKPMKAGKALLLSDYVDNWHGIADLSDTLTVRRWKEYCNSRSKN